MKFGLTELTIDSINAIFKNWHEVEKVIIYGSRSKGNYKNGSDIDLTLIGKDLTDEILSNIQVAIDNLNLPYLIDFSLFDELNSSSLEEHINKIGQVFYRRVT